MATVVMLTLTTTGCVKDQVKDYGTQLGLSPAIVQELELLGRSMDESEKQFIDSLPGYSQDTQHNLVKLAADGEIGTNDTSLLNVLPKYIQTEQEKLISLVTADSNITDDESKGLIYLSDFSEDVKDNLISKFGLNDEGINWLSYLSGLLDKDFAEYAVKTNLTMEDKKLEELERNFLSDPDKYASEVGNFYIDKIGKTNPELVYELRKLPDLKSIEKDDVDSIEDILYLSQDPTTSAKWGGFDALLDEGIKDKRKYCATLESLKLILNDEDPFFVIERKWDYGSFEHVKKSNIPDPILLTAYAWRNTSKSKFVETADLKGYQGEMWNSYDETMDRVNSPYLVNLWVSDNIKFSQARIKNVGDPETLFKLKKGVCRHSGMFTTEALSRAGYNPKNFTVGWQGGGHSVSIIETDEGLVIVMDFPTYREYWITQPFNSQKEAAEYVFKTQPHPGITNISTTFIETNEQMIERVKRVYGVSAP